MVTFFFGEFVRRKKTHFMRYFIANLMATSKGVKFVLFCSFTVCVCVCAVNDGVGNAIYLKRRIFDTSRRKKNSLGNHITMHIEQPPIELLFNIYIRY